MDSRKAATVGRYEAMIHPWSSSPGHGTLQWTFLQNLIVPCKLLRVSPENTPSRADRVTSRNLIPPSFFNAEVALDRLRDFMIELHDVIRTGLDAAGPTRDTPLCLLNSHFLRQPLLDFIEVLYSLLGFQVRHLSPGGPIVFLLSEVL